MNDPFQEMTLASKEKYGTEPTRSWLIEQRRAPWNFQRLQNSAVKKHKWALTHVAQLGVVPQTTGSPAQFPVRYMPGLQAKYPAGAHRRGNQSMFLSHIDVPLPLFLPPIPCVKYIIFLKWWRVFKCPWPL